MLAWAVFSFSNAAPISSTLLWNASSAFSMALSLSPVFLMNASEMAFSLGPRSLMSVSVMEFGDSPLPSIFLVSSMCP